MDQPNHVKEVGILSNLHKQCLFGWIEVFENSRINLADIETQMTPLNQFMPSSNVLR